MLNLSILSDKIWIHRSPWYLDIWNNLNSISILHSRLAVKILKGRFWNIASVYSQLHFKLHVVKSTNNNTQYHGSICNSNVPFWALKIRIILQKLYHCQTQLNSTFNIQFIVLLTNKSSSSRFSLDGAIYRNRNSLKLLKPAIF